MQVIKIDVSLCLEHRGRNGWAKTSGFEAFQSADRCKPEGYLRVSPVNSQGLSGSCEIEIPVAKLDDFIDMLRTEAQPAAAQTV